MPQPDGFYGPVRHCPFAREITQPGDQMHKLRNDCEQVFNRPMQKDSKTEILKPFLSTLRIRD